MPQVTNQIVDIIVSVRKGLCLHMSRGRDLVTADKLAPLSCDDQSLSQLKKRFTTQTP